jgi:plasmid stabilization system protein ParE
MVKWSLRARADLKAIHDYIAKDAPGHAKTVVQEIRRTADSVAELPYLGRKVPEVNDEQLREVPSYSWRILYQVRNGEVFIVTLVHKRRHVIADQITPEQTAQ